METWELLRTNLASPVCLAFALGVVSRLIRSELSLPRDLYTSLGIYLLLALGLKGGVELSQTSFAVIFWPAVVTLLLGCLTPVSSYFVLRRWGKFSAADAAGIAAHYGSVSAVTFMAAQQFVAVSGKLFAFPTGTQSMVTACAGREKHRATRTSSQRTGITSCRRGGTGRMHYPSGLRTAAPR
jgi:hypothetical protein